MKAHNYGEKRTYNFKKLGFEILDFSVYKLNCILVDGGRDFYVDPFANIVNLRVVDNFSRPLQLQVLFKFFNTDV